MSAEAFGRVDLVAFDIDGTLTDGTTTWLGPEIGWTQTYSTRDGEAMLRLLKIGLYVMPLSRNKTACARARMEGLGLPLDWLGVTDKVEALRAISTRYVVSLDRVCYVGDGLEDAAVFSLVGCGCAVADAHPRARSAAGFVTEARGGHRAFEEVALRILDARGVPL
jgi:3-deoxy-D-manno-octulosonate 8-phosphate phosphatase (KDO 8-P phosphatase)